MKTGIVHQNVDARVAVNRHADQADDVFDLRDVSEMERRFSSRADDGLRDGHSGFGVDVIHDNGNALARQGLGNGFTQPAAGAGNNRHPAFELAAQFECAASPVRWNWWSWVSPF